MDVNGTPFWQAASASEFGFAGSFEDLPENLVWDAKHRVVRLAGEQAAPDFAENESFARDMLPIPSAVCDEHGSFAWWDGPGSALLASGFMPGSSQIDLPDDDPVGVRQPTDMAFDRDILFIARNDGVLMWDLRGRWLPHRMKSDGFDAHLIAPIGNAEILLLDRGNGGFAIGSGTPLRHRGYDFDELERFRPKRDNPDAPQLEPIANVAIPAPHEPVAMAGYEDGRAAILCWNPGGEALIYLYEKGQIIASAPLANLSFPVSLAFDGPDAIAVMASDGEGIANRALSYDLDELFGEADSALPNGKVYPLVGHSGQGFCNALGPVPRYLASVDGSNMPQILQKLRAISRPTYARAGNLQLGPFDSGQYDCSWHRLYLEAAFQGHSGIRVWARCSNRGELLDAPTLDEPNGWAAHDFGTLPTNQFPRGSWSHHASEIPNHPGLSDCPRERDRSGLFTALLQHSDRKVRRLSGRYLYLYVELLGDGQHSPELFALRAYGQRFAYRDKYLPELYRETLAGDSAAAAGGATPADFMDRFLGLFEAELTETEGRVAQSWQFTDPLVAPDDALPWLAQWVGVDATAYADPSKLRQRLACAAHMARLQGTLGGLRAALEIESGGILVRGGQLDPSRPVPRPGEIAEANIDGKHMRALVLSVADPRGGGSSQILVGGGVTSGRIAIVEGFRLRRTFATILGADLADEHDPLTLGMVQSGNSIVGDTLILGDENNRKLLALFSDDLPKSLAERRAVDDFLAKLAYRTLILVRGSDGESDIARIEKAAYSAAPAHVALDVVESDSSFIAGMSSLVGIDSFMVDPALPERVQIDQSEIGSGDVIEGEGMLDARADGPLPYPPIARADGPEEVMSDSAFFLSALRSRADTGRVIDRYVWMWK